MSFPLKTYAVNGVPLEAYGLKGIALDSWLQPPTRRMGEMTPIGRVGRVESGVGMEFEPAVLGLGVRTDAATTIAGARATLDSWYYALQGLLEIEIIDGPGRVRYGYLESVADDVFGIKLLSPRLTAVASIVCRNPLWYDREPTMIGAAVATRITLPTGSQAGWWRMRILGAATNPIVTLRSRQGIVLAQLRLTATLLSTEAIVIDPIADPPTITRYTAGVGADALNDLNTGDAFASLVIDPLDGTTAEVSSGTLVFDTWKAHLT